MTAPTTIQMSLFGMADLPDGGPLGGGSLGGGSLGGGPIVAGRAKRRKAAAPRRFGPGLPVAAGRDFRVEVPVTQDQAKVLFALASARACTVAEVIEAGLLLAPDRVDLPTSADGDKPVGAGQMALPVTLSHRVGSARLAACIAFLCGVSDQALALVPAETAARIDRLVQDAEKLRDALDKAAFRPLANGILTPRDAAFALGFASEFRLKADDINQRFRQLASVYHPDAGLFADDARMTQIIEARRLLLDYVRARNS